MPTSEELQERLHHFMHLMRVSGDAHRGRDAFSGQGRVLSLLALNNPVAQKELAYVLGIRSQSLAELLTKMEDKGLVERGPNPADRRTRIVSLTDEGRAAARDLEQSKSDVQDPFAALNDEDRDELHRLLGKLIDGVKATMPDGDYPPPPPHWPPPPPPPPPWAPWPPSAGSSQP